MCLKCGESKEYSQFYVCKSRKDGLRQYCKQCEQLVNSQYKRDNKERLKDSYKEYRIVNRDKVSEYHKNYREKNKKERTAYNKEYHKIYRVKNKQKLNHIKRKYKAAKIKAVPVWLTDEQLKQIENMYKNCPIGYHVDHIIPLQGKNVCGLHVPWNLQYLTAFENKTKGNRLK